MTSADDIRTKFGFEYTMVSQTLINDIQSELDNLYALSSITEQQKTFVKSISYSSITENDRNKFFDEINDYAKSKNFGYQRIINGNSLEIHVDLNLPYACGLTGFTMTTEKVV